MVTAPVGAHSATTTNPTTSAKPPALRARVLPWICLLVVQASLAYALNTALVSKFSAHDAQASRAEQAPTAVYVLDDDSGLACNGAGCGHWEPIGCGRWVPTAVQAGAPVALHDDENGAACDRAP